MCRVCVFVFYRVEVGGVFGCLLGSRGGFSSSSIDLVSALLLSGSRFVPFDFSSLPYLLSLLCFSVLRVCVAVLANFGGVQRLIYPCAECSLKS